MNKDLKLWENFIKIIQTFVRNVDKDPRVVKTIILKFQDFVVLNYNVGSFFLIW